MGKHLRAQHGVSLDENAPSEDVDRCDYMKMMGEDGFVV